MADTAKFCPSCGQVAGAAPAPGPGAGPATGAPAAQAGTGLSSTAAAGLSYVLGFITGILFLLIEPHSRDPFVRFHAFQSIMFSVACMVVMTVVSVIPFLGPILAVFLWIGCIAIWIFLLIQAFNGKKWKLPVLGDYAERQV